MEAVMAEQSTYSDNLLDAALDYARRDWSVFPLRPRDKRPLVDWDARQKVRASENHIRAHWGNNPSANIAIVTGAISGLVVLDLDGQTGRVSVAGKPLPMTPVAVTGKGWHYYFRHPGFPVANFAGRLPGVDLRGDGGYVVAPPSVHPSGSLYQWAGGLSPNDVGLAPLPEWVLELIRTKPGSPVSPIEWTAPVQEGRRNAELTRRAGSLLTKMPAGEALTMLQAWNEAHCSPPLPADEVAQIVRSIAVREARKAVQEDFGNSLKPQDFTDVGQAHVFAQEYGGRLRYSLATKYLVFSGQVWQESEIKAHRLAQELTERQLKEAREGLRQAQRAEDAAAAKGDQQAQTTAKAAVKGAEGYRDYVLARRLSSKVAATLKEAQPMLEVEIDSLDADPFKLNTPTGTVDLRSGTLNPHHPQDYCTKITAVAPSTEGADLFASFLGLITCGDKELEAYLQTAMGMAAVGAVFHEHLLIAYGGGRNGKSTFFNLLSRVLGDYSGGMSAEIITVSNRQNKKPEFAELRGKRLIVCSELGEGLRLDTAAMKKLCSTDPIQAEKKYKDPFRFTPSHTTVLYTNHLPKVGTSDAGTWRRLVVIPFRAYIPEENDIKNYSDHLFRLAGGAVLTWVIEGAGQYIASGYTLPKPTCVTQAVEQYRADNDWLNHYLAERCETGRNYSQASGSLYQDYRLYCTLSGEYTRSAADFRTAIEAAGYDVRKTQRGAFVYGLRIRPEFGVYTGRTTADSCEGDGR